jgi:hypothetical protein
MILLLKYICDYTTISSSYLIIFITLIGSLSFFYFKTAVVLLLCDIYIFTVLANYKITSSCMSSYISPSCKLEIVAEGQKLAETSDLAKMMDHYGNKFIK